jgi:hypothetical protein
MLGHARITITVDAYTHPSRTPATGKTSAPAGPPAHSPTCSNPPQPRPPRRRSNSDDGPYVQKQARARRTLDSWSSSRRASRAGPAKAPAPHRKVLAPRGHGLLPRRAGTRVGGASVAQVRRCQRSTSTPRPGATPMPRRPPHAARPLPPRRGPDVAADRLMGSVPAPGVPSATANRRCLQDGAPLSRGIRSGSPATGRFGRRTCCPRARDRRRRATSGRPSSSAPRRAGAARRAVRPGCRTAGR